jgi:superfamily II DNA or RNA helicase
MVSGETRPATRRFLIEEFREGRISVLCNYGVLTTGFDAPRVRALVIARPTASPVLYEQMIGRGMRGPRFGGTEECLVYDLADNIRFGGQMAFSRYSDYWTSHA